MNCDEAVRWFGGEIERLATGDEQAELDAHLESCAACRAAADGLRIVDADLRLAFAPRRAAAAALAERVGEQLAERAAPATSSRPSLASRHLALAMAAAAGFLLAVGIFQPWREPTGAQSAARPVTGAPRLGVAALTLATGPVEVFPAKGSAWSVCPPGEPIEGGDAVRTGADARCEFKCPDYGEVCLDAKTEVRFASPGKVSLLNGQILSCSTGGEKPLVVESPEGTVAARQATVEMRREAGRTTLSVLSGTAQVDVAGTRHTVPAGHSLSMDATTCSTGAAASDPLLTSGWVSELLLLKGLDSPALAARVERLLARAASDGVHSEAYFDQLRRLGAGSVAPLLRYLSAKPTADAALRRAAARIAGDLAMNPHLAPLVDLLADRDGDVRVYAAGALTRLTGRDHGRKADAWRDPWSDCQPTHQRWKAWLAEQPAGISRGDM